MITQLILVTSICVAAVTFLTGHMPAKNDRSAEKATVGPYIVTWAGHNCVTDQPDTLMICRKRSAKPAFVYDGLTLVDDVSEWSAPTRGNSRIRGILVTSSFIGGISSAVTILAEVRGSFRKVFEGDCWNGLDLSGPPYQWVHLDKNRAPELLIPTRSMKSMDYALGTDRARVWKWSNRQEKYIMVRETTWEDRLKPLIPHASIHSGRLGPDVE